MTNQQPSLPVQIIKGIFKWILILLGTMLLIGAATGAILAWYGASYVQEVILPEAESAATALDLPPTVYTAVVSGCFFRNDTAWS